MITLTMLAWSASADARPVTAVWDRNTDAVTIGYRLYYGASSGNYAIEIDVGNVTTYPLNLIPGIPHYFVVRAYNAQGQVGPPSNEFPITLPNQAPLLANPGNITISPGAIAFQLSAIDPDGDPLTFTVTGLPSSVSVNTSTGHLSGSLAAGAYVVTATASDGNLQSRQVFTVTVTGATCSPPSAPTMQAPVVNGSHATVSWVSPVGTPPATSHVVSVGTAPTLSNLLVLNTGLSTSIGGNVPDGMYYVRAVSVNACGHSAASNEVSFRVGVAAGPPGAPGTLTFQRTGNYVSLNWAAPAGGSPATGFVIEVGTASGLANLLVVPIPSAVTRVTAVAPPGVYYVRIRATNAAGSGSPSNQVAITIP